MALTVTTWNVNSVRLRPELIARFLDQSAPDVLCLQEVKVEDQKFPDEPFARYGYVHRALHGQKGYHGVAILSRLPLTGIGHRFAWGLEERRHVWAVLPDGTELHCLYVPAGGDVPDPETNRKFAHKLGFVAETAAWLAAERRPDQKLILVGDLNIAPLEHDVWSHRQLLDVVSHTPVEVAHLAQLQASLGFHDAGRRFVPPEEKLYSWWSYRNRDWAASDRGRRLDHIWVTAPLAGSLVACDHLRAARGWDQPSDHVPVTATFG